MANDLSTTKNAYLQGIYEGIIKNEEYKNLIGKDIATQKSELKKIFAKIADNDVSSAEKAHLELAVEKLSGEIAKIEEQMEDIGKQIEEKQKEVDKRVTTITDLVTKTKNTSAKMENEHYDHVKNVIRGVFYDYERGNDGVKKDNIKAKIQERIKGEPGLSSYKNEITRCLSNIDSQESVIKGLSDEITGIVDKVGSLKQQFATLNSAKTLIDKTIGQIGNTDTTYTNSDYNSAVPTYSLDKTAIVSSLFTNKNYNVASTNTDYKEGSTPSKSGLSADEIKEKYGSEGKGYLGVSATKGKDKYSINNAATKALGSALNDQEFLNDILNSQMSSSEIAKFFKENFSGAEIQLTKDGNFSIPKGHGAEAQGIYNKLVKFVNTDLNNREVYTKNTWDKNKGNTISSNEQLKALSENYETILETLAKGKPAFSFKEAMYALFDSKHGLFKDSGINYDLTQQGSTPSYSIDTAGDAETAKIYKGIAGKIEEYWGVKPSGDSAIGTEEFDEEVEEEPKVETRTDPLTFRDKDGAECAFIIDRDNNDNISGLNEFLGAQEGKSWLDDLKSLDLDGDGKLTGDELKNLKVLKSKYTDNAKTTMTDGKYLHETENNIDYAVTDAAALGIEEIDLSNLEDKVGKSTGKTDINGSELFEDSFTFKMDGKEVTVSRKDDTSEFMKTVYADAKGKSFHIGFSESEVDENIKANYKEFNNRITPAQMDFLNNNKDLYNRYMQLKTDTRKSYDDTLDRMERYDELQKTQAAQKIDSEREVSAWNKIGASVISVAMDRGIATNDEVLEQLKGICYSKPSYTAQQIVDTYQAQQNEIKQLENDKNISSTVMETMVKCFKTGITTSASEIKEIISSGKATTVEDIIKYLEEKKTEES